MNGIHILVVGLPFSGKRHFIKNWLKDKEGVFTVVDDALDVDQYFEFICENPNTVMLTPFLCLDLYRSKLIQVLDTFGIDYEVFYFENNPDKCAILANESEATVDFTKYDYDLPEDVEFIEIWQPELITD